jgi:hypothetical protein
MLHISVCGRCGRQFRTQFAPPPGQPSLSKKKRSKSFLLVSLASGMIIALYLLGAALSRSQDKKAFLGLNAPGIAASSSGQIPEADSAPVHIRWRARTCDILMGELENTLNRPLNNVLISASIRVYDHKNGFYLGSHLESTDTRHIGMADPQPLEYDAARRAIWSHTKPRSILYPGERACFSLMQFAQSGESGTIEEITLTENGKPLPFIESVEP